MLRFTKKFSIALLSLFGAVSVYGFSLIGPFDTWQANNVGYNFTFNTPVIGISGDVGGPMNLGEEYRWNTPFVSFGFDPSFLEFFGQKGVDAVEAAVAILNDVPAASQMSSDLSEYPLDTRRFNHRASALRIRDLKSWTLSVLLETLGLAAPERYIYTLRSRVAGIPPSYTVIKRNFDPATLLPTSYVNGTLYTFNIFQTYITPPFDAWEAVELSVDPLAPSVTSVAAYAGVLGGKTDSRAGAVLFNPGIFYTGLTRDDVGGIRYLLRSSNFNVEPLPLNSISGAGGGGGGSSSTGGGLPWLVVGGPTGGGVGAGGAGGAGGVGGAGGGLGGGLTTTNSIVDTALRPGVDKLTFVRADFDSALGQFFTNNVVYSDRFITNGVSRDQLVQRTQIQPDIVFTAADLGVDGGGAPILFSRTITYLDNSLLNTGAGGAGIAGPGTIDGPVQINFSRIGPFTRHFGDGPEQLGTAGLVWGSFDASTNAPVIFPSEISMQELEQIVLQRSGGSPWEVAP